MDTDPVQAVDALVSRLAATLAGAAPNQGGERTGYGADGRIAARIGADGHISAITLEPVLARAPREEIAAGIVTAVNEAVDARPAGAGSTSLVPELKAIQQESVVLTKTMNGALLSALEQLKASQ